MSIIFLIVVLYFFIIRPLKEEIEETKLNRASERAKAEAEERKRKEKKQVEIDSFIKQVRRKYPKAYSKISKFRSDENMYDNLSLNDFYHCELDIRDQELFAYNQENRRKHQEEIKKIEEERNRNTSIGELYSIVASWSKISGKLPVYSLYYYYPKYCKELVLNDKQIRCREDIWKFKDGNMMFDYYVGNVLYHFFEHRLKYLTFVCVPASGIVTNSRRYWYFTKNLCEKYGMENAFQHITINKNRTSSHLGGTTDADNYKLDANFFRGKHVIIFDDITTSGSSLLLMKQKLELAGAQVVCAITLGKTVYENMGTDPYDVLFNR